MMRSMFSGVSGLRIHQTRMDVIANNISNVNTVGFKSSRVLFSDVFSQTVQGATGSNIEGTGRGGVNAMQIGLGAQVASIDRMMTQGAAQRTDHAFDLMLEGPGFFVVGDATGTYFTRNGAIRPDAFGNLLISNGMQLMGWEVTGPHSHPNDSSEWGQVQRGQVRGLTITDQMRSVPPIPTSRVNFGGNLVPEQRWSEDRNLEAEPPVFGTLVNMPVPITMQIHDTIGNTHMISGTIFMTTAGGASPDAQYTVWRMELDINDEDGNALQFDIWFDANGRMRHVASTEAAAVMVGNAPNATLPAETNLAEEIALILQQPPAGVNFGGTGGAPITLNFSGFTQFGSVRGTANATNVDGRSAGLLQDLSIGQDGTVMGRYDNGAVQALFRIPVAEFENPAGLESVGGSLFQATINSGEWNGIGQDGNMRGGVLEMSNVDLSEEFTSMIVTQRGFQANSRTITTSDDMLQELVNLRR